MAFISNNNDNDDHNDNNNNDNNTTTINNNDINDINNNNDKSFHCYLKKLTIFTQQMEQWLGTIWMLIFMCQSLIYAFIGTNILNLADKDPI